MLLLMMLVMLVLLGEGRKHITLVSLELRTEGTAEIHCIVSKQGHTKSVFKKLDEPNTKCLNDST
jgi:hypothetical protein